ncbi:hypothetical protein J2Z83_000680 [Virgibacillus natechei]|uniref:Uncharacterized protein n=1 Tax=Virgibacillus natechei TaxID=1216297 RepID=A0ABS4ICK5_9BACI|nr:hypothetical protein [Virgibacillus natechei]MBP1968588.1 hypothetical protein [Virgibacillus natechei]UZD13698.1 hypothetical protein OLD84_03840 [Virgibacillus natechei]
MKQHPIFRYLYIFYSFVFVIHIVNVFIESDNLNYILGILALIMLAVSFAGASRLFKILGSAFILIGSVVFAASGQSIETIPALLTSNMSLLTLLAMLPWMNSVVRSGRFDQSLNNLLKVNVSDLGKLYPRSSITTLTLASFLNLSAATISQDVLKENLRPLDKKLRDSFIATATLRGYSLALLWSPLEILLAVSIFTTGVDYVSLLPWLLMIAAITFILDSIWGRFHYKKYAYENTNKQSINMKEMIKKIVHLLVALVLFLSLVISLGNLFNLDFIFTVTILIFPFAFIWSLIMKRRRSFWTIGWNTWKAKTNTMQNFIVLFISLAFFANSIDGTPFLDFIQQPILAFSDYPIVIFVMIQLIFIFMSMFGIHPIATIGILSGGIATLLEFMNPVSIAIVLVTSSIATLTVGTYGLVVQLTAVNTGQNPYRITINNLLYSLFFGGIGTVVAYFLL